MVQQAKGKEGKTMASRARPKEQLVEFMEITKENIDDVVEWCEGWKAGLTQVEYHSQLRGHYGKAVIGNILVKEYPTIRHFREYSKEEFNACFEVIDNAPSGG